MILEQADFINSVNQETTAKILRMLLVSKIKKSSFQNNLQQITANKIINTCYSNILYYNDVTKYATKGVDLKQNKPLQRHTWAPLCGEAQVLNLFLLVFVGL